MYVGPDMCRMSSAHSIASKSFPRLSDVFTSPEIMLSDTKWIAARGDIFVIMLAWLIAQITGMVFLKC